MIEKYIIVNDREALAIRDDGSVVRITAESDVKSLVAWMLQPRSDIRTLSEYKSAVQGMSEDTQTIDLEEK